MRNRLKYGLPAAEDIAPELLAVSAVGMHIDQTPTHALWAAVEAAAGARIAHPSPASSLAACRSDAELFRAAALRSVFRHWSVKGTAVEEFVEDYPVMGYFGIPTRLDRQRDIEVLCTEYVASMRRTLHDGVGAAFHDIAPLSGVLANSAGASLWRHVFDRFDRAADLPAMLLFAEDGLATRSTFGGWLPQAGEIPEQTFARERRNNSDLGNVFAGLMLTRSVAVVRLLELAEHVRDASQTVSFGDGRKGRTAHGFGSWTREFIARHQGHGQLFPFKPTEHVPRAWSRPQCAQFDAMPVLAWVYRPQTANYLADDRTRLPSEQCAEQLRIALQAAIDGPLNGKAPARILYDVGVGDSSGERRLLLWNAVRAVLPDFDLLDVARSYDLFRLLGDTGAGTTFAGVGLATLAAWETGSTALVVHARGTDGATVMAIKPPRDAYRQQFSRRPYDPT